MSKTRDRYIPDDNIYRIQFFMNNKVNTLQAKSHISGSWLPSHIGAIFTRIGRTCTSLCTASVKTVVTHYMHNGSAVLG